MLSMLVFQGLEDCEVIIINDGSTDQTENICKYYEKHKEINVFSISNSGVSIARNTGLIFAKGKYVYFLDSDDMLMPDTLSFFKKKLRERSHVDFFSFGYKSCTNGKRQKKYVYQRYSGTQFDDSMVFLELFLCKKIFFNICSIVVSNALLRENNILFNPELKIGEDLQFIIKILSLRKAAYYESRLCFIYKIRYDSSSQYKNYNEDKFKFIIELQETVSVITKNYPNISEKVNLFVGNIYCVQLYCYLKSKLICATMNEKFLDNKKILYFKMSANLFLKLRILIIRFIPLLLLFRFLKRKK